MSLCRWVDGLVGVVWVRWLGPAAAQSSVRGSIHTMCGKQLPAPRLQWDPRWERAIYKHTHTHIYSHGVRLSHYEGKLFPIAVLLLLNKHTLLNPVKLAVVFNRLDVICLLALIHYSGWWSGSVQSEELSAPSLREHELSERNTKWIRHSN